MATDELPELLPPSFFTREDTILSTHSPSKIITIKIANNTTKQLMRGKRMKSEKLIGHRGLNIL